MPARPPRLEKLRHGRLLVGRVFRFFVETWNWLTDYVDNLCGDCDENPQTGIVTVDRSKPDRPVIRLRLDRLQLGAGGPAVAVSADGPFSPIYEEDDDGEPTETVTGFQNCYFMNGGRIVAMSDQSLPGANGFIALKVGATSTTSGDAELLCYSTIDALKAAQNDVAAFTIPLYRVAASKITLDMRRIPVVFAAEVFA